MGAVHPTRSVSRVRIMLPVAPYRQFFLYGIWYRGVPAYREANRSVPAPPAPFGGRPGVLVAKCSEAHDAIRLLDPWHMPPA